VTAGARRKLTVILAAAGPGGAGCDTWDAPLCGRPAAAWLLDTVEALQPDAISFAGGATAVRECGEARPAVARLLAAATGAARGQRQRAGITVIMPGRSPLVQPATVQRAMRALAANSGPRAALVRARGAAPWWAESPAADTAALVACAGLSDDHLEWLARQDLADAGALQRRLRKLGARVTVVDAGPVESLRTDDPVDRQLAEAALYQKIAAGWQQRGVTIDSPLTTRIDATARIGPGSRIRSHTELAGDTVVGSGASIGPCTSITDSLAGDGCVISYSVCDQVTIGEGGNIGPYCWLRSGTQLGARVRAGSFVEMSDSVIGDDTAMPHLGALLSVVVGQGCNIAGLSGTANFDGQRKHRVEIGNHVSIGGGNVLVAPMRVGDGAYTAAGSVLTGDVPSGALAIARPNQVNVDGWVARKRPASAAALALAQAAE
jgi:acetyltransferase-like isoleucine patch superfamily enzyme